MGARRIARYAWACFLQASGALGRAKRKLSQSHSIVVLTMHRVLDEHQFAVTNSLPGTLLRRSTFARLIDYARQQVSVVAVSDCKPGEDADRLRIALTFDDGWLDNYTTALSIIREAGVPVTVFVCPALVDQCSPFWPENLIAQLRANAVNADEIEKRVEEIKALPAERRKMYLATLGGRAGQPGNDADRTLSWEQMCEMAEAGITFGSHTQTHEILTTVPASMAREELEWSKEDIQRALRRPCRMLSYPNGNHSPATKELAAACGFERAFTTVGTPWSAGCDPLAIPRVNLAEDDVTDPAGSFSRLLFDYTVFWKPLHRSLVQS